MHQLDEQNMPIHRALLIPEILDQIFIQMLPSKDCIDPLIKSSIRDLQSCACVSRLWNIMATRQLWYNPCYLQGDNIPKVLSKIEHERRQYYASHIKEGSLFTFPDRNPKLSPKEPIDVLDELEFPKLRYVTLVAGYHASVVPPIKSQNVRTLVIDPKHWLYRGIFVNMAEVGRILEQVPSCFPNLESVIFVRRGDVSRKAIQRLSHRLPRLRTIDDSEMVVRN